MTFEPSREKIVELLRDGQNDVIDSSSDAEGDAEQSRVAKSQGLDMRQKEIHDLWGMTTTTHTTTASASGQVSNQEDLLSSQDIHSSEDILSSQEDPF